MFALSLTAAALDCSDVGTNPDLKSYDDGQLPSFDKLSEKCKAALTSCKQYEDNTKKAKEDALKADEGKKSAIGAIPSCANATQKTAQQCSSNAYSTTSGAYGSSGTKKGTAGETMNDPRETCYKDAAKPENAKACENDKQEINDQLAKGNKFQRALECSQKYDQEQASMYKDLSEKERPIIAGLGPTPGSTPAPSTVTGSDTPGGKDTPGGSSASGSPSDSGSGQSQPQGQQQAQSQPQQQPQQGGGQGGQPSSQPSQITKPGELGATSPTPDNNNNIDSKGTATAANDDTKTTPTGTFLISNNSGEKTLTDLGALQASKTPVIAPPGTPASASGSGGAERNNVGVGTTGAGSLRPQLARSLASYGTTGSSSGGPGGVNDTATLAKAGIAPENPKRDENGGWSGAGGSSSSSSSGSSSPSPQNEVLNPFAKPLGDPKFSLMGSETDSAIKKMLGEVDAPEAQAAEGEVLTADGGIGDKNGPSLFARAHLTYESSLRKGRVRGIAIR